MNAAALPAAALEPDGRLRAIWHDVECGHYREDLPLWHALADACPGPVLDIGAGTGRVALALAARGHEVTAVDHDPALLAVLSERAAARGLEVVTAVHDARELPAGERRFGLILVPMQTIQLLGGRAGRRAFLRAARALLAPGGLLAIAVADALEAFDSVVDGLPSPDVLERDGHRYESQTVALIDEGEQLVIHRLRTIDGGARASNDRLALDRVEARELAREALALGFARKPMRAIAETDHYEGSTVVICGG